MAWKSVVRQNPGGDGRGAVGKEHGMNAWPLIWLAVAAIVALPFAAAAPIHAAILQFGSFSILPFSIFSFSPAFA